MFNISNKKEYEEFCDRLREFFRNEGFQSLEIEKEVGVAHSHVMNDLPTEGIGGIAKQLMILKVTAIYDTND